MKHELGAYLLEVVTPRTNAALLSSAEHLFGALTLVPDLVWWRSILAPTTNGVVFSSASARPANGSTWLANGVPPTRRPSYVSWIWRTLVADPARLGDDEQLAACTLGLRAAPYLPLRDLR